MSNLMNSLAGFDETVPLWEAVNNLLDNSFLNPAWNGGNRAGFGSGNNVRQALAYAPLSISEDNSHYYILGLLPGIEYDKLELTVKENVLTLSGEYAFNDWPQTEPTGTTSTTDQSKGGDKVPSGQVQTLLNELPQGHFYRQVSLPTAFDFDRAQAQYHNGMLKIVLPKAENQQVKRISVQPHPTTNQLENSSSS